MVVMLQTEIHQTLRLVLVACDDLMKAEGNDPPLNTKAGDRSVQEIPISLAENIISGTPNGIKMDTDSGLVYSPSHFTLRY